MNNFIKNHLNNYLSSIKMNILIKKHTFINPDYNLPPD